MMTIKPATRTGIKPLVGIFGKSGSGKTMSALLFARGLVGPTGRITLIDTENGRGSIFSDIPEIAGYSVLELDAPFSPSRYGEAIVQAEAVSDCVVVDSMSHEWSGEGGVIDWADAELEKMGGDDRNKMRSWIKPKMAHKMMVGRLLRCKVALICCLRGDEKTHAIKEGGKTKVVTDEFSSPLFDPRFVFEMLINFETIAKDGKGGFVIPRKITHPSIASLLPSPDEQIGVAHGVALARWCSAPGPVAPSAPQAAPPANAELKALKSKLWHTTVGIHKGVPAALEQRLWDEGIIADTESLAELSAERLAQVLNKVTEKLKAKGTA